MPVLAICGVPRRISRKRFQCNRAKTSTLRAVWCAGGCRTSPALPVTSPTSSLPSRITETPSSGSSLRARGGILDPKIGEQDLHSIDSYDWPAPLIKMFIGDAKPEDVTAAALQGDANVVAGHQCEANFYIAEWWLAQKDAVSAKPLLEAAVKNCPKNFIEADAARSELGAIK